MNGAMPPGTNIVRRRSPQGTTEFVIFLSRNNPEHLRLTVCFNTCLFPFAGPLTRAFPMIYQRGRLQSEVWTGVSLS
jgi:hypothetical protein